MCIIVKKFHVFQSGRIKQYIKIGNGISVKLQLLLFCWQKHVFTFNFCFGLHTMKINTRLHALINLYKSYVIYKGRLLLCQQTCLFTIYNIYLSFSRYFFGFIQISLFVNLSKVTIIGRYWYWMFSMKIWDKSGFIINSLRVYSEYAEPVHFLNVN